MSMRATLIRDFGDVAATDRDWASPEFDHLSPYIATLLAGPNDYTPEEREIQAQRHRDARPYLIAHIRRNLGDPKWNPRGAQVLPLRRAD